MYPPARAFSLGDIITPDPTCSDPLPNAKYWEDRKFVLPLNTNRSLKDRYDDTMEQDILESLDYGRTMTVEYAPRSMCVGCDMPDAVYDDYLLPPDPDAPQIPDDMLAKGCMLAVNIASDLYARVIGRTIIGIPCCTKGDLAFNAATRIWALRRSHILADTYKRNYDDIKPRVDELSEQLRVQTNANGALYRKYKEAHDLNRKLTRKLENYQLGLTDEERELLS
jgi:hypothetical protein